MPDGEETISYQIPTVKLHGKYVVYFSGWKSHISVYPLPSGDEAFERDIAPYKAGKGTAKFPLNKPIPYDLIKRMTVRPARTSARWSTVTERHPSDGSLILPFRDPAGV